jgi:hypothetical protein
MKYAFSHFWILKESSLCSLKSLQKESLLSLSNFSTTSAEFNLRFVNLIKFELSFHLKTSQHSQFQ